MSKKVLAIVGVIVLILAVGGGAFYGGMMYQSSRVDRIRAAFFAGRGGAGGGGGGGGGAGGRVFGQIKSIDGDTLVLSTPQNVTTVKLTDSTVINKLAQGARSDLQPGESISIRADRDASGNVTATDIQILGQAANTLAP